MSMTSIPLLILAEALGPILLVIGLQRFVITVFATLFVFRLMGRSYDAGVTRAGFAGLGLNTISPT